jgi:hypothetical protein
MQAEICVPKSCESVWFMTGEDEAHKPWSGGQWEEGDPSVEYSRDGRCRRYQSDDPLMSQNIRRVLLV